ncbi:hypothetical protein HDU96_003337, partial [Phlyctochytrium bullatum]
MEKNRLKPTPRKDNMPFNVRKGSDKDLSFPYPVARNTSVPYGLNPVAKNPSFLSPASWNPSFPYGPNLVARNPSFPYGPNLVARNPSFPSSVERNPSVPSPIAREPLQKGKVNRILPVSVFTSVLFYIQKKNRKNPGRRERELIEKKKQNGKALESDPSKKSTQSAEARHEARIEETQSTEARHKQTQSAEAHHEEAPYVEAMDTETHSVDGMDTETHSVDAMYTETRSGKAPHSETRSRKAPPEENPFRDAYHNETPSGEAMDTKTRSGEAPHDETLLSEARHGETQCVEAMDTETQSVEAQHHESQSVKAPHNETQSVEAKNAEILSIRAINAATTQTGNEKPSVEFMDLTIDSPPEPTESACVDLTNGAETPADSAESSQKKAKQKEKVNVSKDQDVAELDEVNFDISKDLDAADLLYPKDRHVLNGACFLQGLFGKANSASKDTVLGHVAGNPITPRLLDSIISPESKLDDEIINS